MQLEVSNFETRVLQFNERLKHRVNIVNTFSTKHLAILCLHFYHASKMCLSPKYVIGSVKLRNTYLNHTYLPTV